MGVQHISLRVENEFSSQLLDVTRRNMQLPESERILLQHISSLHLAHEIEQLTKIDPKILPNALLFKYSGSFPLSPCARVLKVIPNAPYNSFVGSVYISKGQPNNSRYGLMSS